LETSLLKKYSLSSICNVIVCSLIIVGCHVDSQKQSKLNDSESLDTENSESLSDEGLNNEVSPQNVQKIIDAITKTLMPLASDKDKEELNGIIHYFNDIQKNTTGYFEVPENNIEFLKNIMSVALMEGKLKPDDFASQLNVSIQYLQISRTIRELSSSEESDRLSSEYEKKGIQSAFGLVDKFPDNGMSYGHLAHSLSITGGEKKKTIELYKRCLELDRESQFCKEGYAALLGE
jgi:hypothetical protein